MVKHLCITIIKLFARGRKGEYVCGLKRGIGV